MPDPNLRAVIERRLGKASGETITTTEIANLTFLSAKESNISDLTGLESATNLTQLLLNDNSITDISPLAGLNQLTNLGLHRNSISDISPLAGLTNLGILDLQYNSISDISPLVENTGLGNEDFVNLTENPLNALSINTHIPALLSRGVIVAFYNVVARSADVNGDGVVNIFDLVSVAANFGKLGQNLAEDVKCTFVSQIHFQP